MKPDPARVASEVWDRCRSAGFRGSDPYDALNGRFWPGLAGRSGTSRRMLLQAGRRTPRCLRPLLGVPPGLNPKALALFLSSIADLPSLECATESSTFLSDALLSLSSLPDGSPALSGGRRHRQGLAAEVAGGSGVPPAIGWGYDFPWQGRAFFQPPFAPTAVVTSFVARAFEDCESPAAPAVLPAVGRFLLTSLGRYECDEGICFSYSPRDSTRVFNASLLAASALVAAGRRSTPLEAECREAATRAAEYVISRQSSDGSWVYGEGPQWDWIDGFHTGFVLECLYGLAVSLGRTDWLDPVARGLVFYRDRLFLEDGTALGRPGRRGPLDPHAFAQGAITFVKLEELGHDGADFAGRILGRACETLWDERRKGFVFSRGAVLSNGTVHMRWNQAWMLRALCAWLGREAR